MTTWRMSFRVGNQGHEMWPECLRLGIAAIHYRCLDRTDLSRHPAGEPKELWNKLKPTQRASLRRLAYEMKGGDVIYVKQGPKIIDRGIVKGPRDQRAYQFDSTFRLIDPSGNPWAHQVPVAWSSDFREVRLLLGAEQLCVKELSAPDVSLIETAIGRSSVRQHAGPPRETSTDRLIEDAYYRETAARLKTIIPHHKRLSNCFREWLKRRHLIDSVREQDQVDVRFNVNGRSFLAELKVCFGVGTRKSIREALGQLLEYNHYPTRNTADVWMVVLDQQPSSNDRRFVHRLQHECSLPIVLGWQEKRGFTFEGGWTPKLPE
jgi:hypothetical protein